MRERELRWLDQRADLLRSELQLIDLRREDLLQEQEEAEDLAGLPDMRPISKVCAELKLSRAFLTKLCNDGVIPYLQVGNKRLINFGVLTQYLNKAGKGRKENV